MPEITVNSENFKDEVLNHEGLVLVDFWANWCGPCQMLSPVIHEIAQKNIGKIKVCKLNVDNSSDIAQIYNISSIPTLILFKDGTPINQKIGYVSSSEIEQMWK